MPDFLTSLLSSGRKSKRQFNEHRSYSFYLYKLEIKLKIKQIFMKFQKEIQLRDVYLSRVIQN